MESTLLKALNIFRIATTFAPLVPQSGLAGKVIKIGTELEPVVAQFIAAEKSRTGLTTEQIFERAGLQLEENDKQLLADLEKLHSA